jgi:hypothetical protein
VQIVRPGGAGRWRCRADLVPVRSADQPGTVARGTAVDTLITDRLSRQGAPDEQTVRERGDRGAPARGERWLGVQEPVAAGLPHPDAGRILAATGTLYREPLSAPGTGPSAPPVQVRWAPPSRCSPAGCGDDPLGRTPRRSTGASRAASYGQADGLEPAGARAADRVPASHLAGRDPPSLHHLIDPRKASDRRWEACGGHGQDRYVPQLLAGHTHVKRLADA